MIGIVKLDIRMLTSLCYVCFFKFVIPVIYLSLYATKFLIKYRRAIFEVEKFRCMSLLKATHYLSMFALISEPMNVIVTI